MKTPARDDHGEGLNHNRQGWFDPYLFFDADQNQL